MEDNSIRPNSTRLRTWGSQVRALPGARASNARRLVALTSYVDDDDLARAVVELVASTVLRDIVAPIHAVTWDGERGLVTISWLREAGDWRLAVEVGAEVDADGETFESHAVQLYEVDDREEISFSTALTDRVVLSEAERIFVAEICESYRTELLRRYRNDTARVGEERL